MISTFLWQGPLQARLAIVGQQLAYSSLSDDTAAN